MVFQQLKENNKAIIYIADQGYGKSLIKCIVPLAIGTLIIFICGVGYLGSIIGYDKAIEAGLLPFIPSELFKIALAQSGNSLSLDQSPPPITLLSLIHI